MGQRTINSVAKLSSLALGSVKANETSLVFARTFCSTLYVKDFYGKVIGFKMNVYIERGNKCQIRSSKRYSELEEFIMA